VQARRKRQRTPAGITVITFPSRERKEELKNRGTSSNPTGLKTNPENWGEMAYSFGLVGIQPEPGRGDICWCPYNVHRVYPSQSRWISRFSQVGWEGWGVAREVGQLNYLFEGTKKDRSKRGRSLSGSPSGGTTSSVGPPSPNRPSSAERCNGSRSAHINERVVRGWLIRAKRP